MKKTVILLSALALFAVVSCNKAEVPAQRSEKHPVTLTVGLGAETRVSHEYADLGSGKKGIKTQWEVGDQVFVQYDGNTEVFDVVDIAGDGKSAEFHKEDSALPEGASFKVIYATPGYLTDTSDPSTFNISSKQTGALDNLPEYLVADNVTLGSPAELASQLTYFHFVFEDTDSSSSRYYLKRVKFGLMTGSTPFGSTYSGEFLASPSASAAKAVISVTGPNTNDVDPVRYIEVFAAVFLPSDDMAGTTYHVYLEEVTQRGASHDMSTTPIALSWISKTKYQEGKVYTKTFEF